MPTEMNHLYQVTRQDLTSARFATFCSETAEPKLHFRKYRILRRESLIFQRLFTLRFSMGSAASAAQREQKRTKHSPQGHLRSLNGPQQVFIHLDDLEMSLMEFSSSNTLTGENLVELHIFSKQETARTEMNFRQKHAKITADDVCLIAPSLNPT